MDPDRGEGGEECGEGGEFQLYLHTLGYRGWEGRGGSDEGRGQGGGVNWNTEEGRE